MQRTPKLINTPRVRSRHYCFTLNNWIPSDMDELTALGGNRILCKYLIFGEEVGEAGTPHLQGYVVFTNSVGMKRCQELLSSRVKLHIEPAKSFEAAAKYCRKDGKYHEFGRQPDLQRAAAANVANETKKSKNAMFLDAVLNRCDVRELATTFPTQFLQHWKNIEPMRMMLAPPAGNHWRPVKCMWIHGASGIGKSRMARSFYSAEETYLKNVDACKWWNGYTGQKCVIYDDVDEHHSRDLTHHLKIVADGYPFSVEFKGSMGMIRPECIIVTSQFDIKGIFACQETQEAMLRRFEVIHLTTPFVPVSPLPTPLSSSLRDDIDTFSNHFTQSAQLDSTDCELEEIHKRKREGKNEEPEDDDDSCARSYAKEDLGLSDEEIMEILPPLKKKARKE